MHKEVPQDVLVVGSGAREHAFGWKLNRSPRVGNLYFAPGNGGTKTIGTNVDIAAKDIDKIAQFVGDNNINLTIFGPEEPLVRGGVDLLNADHRLAFGPTADAARLEGSKAYAVEIMERDHKLKLYLPLSQIYRDIRKALPGIESFPAQEIVIKADGLAAGKGVKLPNSREEAKQIAIDMMVNGEFGDAGRTIVVQERLYGKELSMLAFTDGVTVVPLLPARDYKRAYDGETLEGKGPNTGGMASFAPVDVSPELFQEIHTDILKRTVDRMRDEGHPYKGILYAGIMLTGKGPKVLEFNARSGDPETQPEMMLFDSDLAEVAFSCINGTLDRNQVRFRDGASACVVLASGGYPGEYKTGFEIHGLPISDSNIEVFQAGTMMKDGKLLTNGGRVMGITAFAPTVGEAFAKADSVIGEEKGIHFDGMHYRKKFL